MRIGEKLVCKKEFKPFDDGNAKDITIRVGDIIDVVHVREYFIKIRYIFADGYTPLGKGVPYVDIPMITDIDMQGHFRYVYNSFESIGEMRERRINEIFE